jgi:hypothetical protein
MQLNGVSIEDTFAEAFGMRATRIVITAINPRWARQAAQTMTGFATSVIGRGWVALVWPFEMRCGLFVASGRRHFCKSENKLLRAPRIIKIVVAVL